MKSAKRLGNTIVQLERANAARDAVTVKMLKAAELGAWTAAQLCEMTGLTLAALSSQRAHNQIVWWADAQGNFHYPKWQFDKRVNVVPAVSDILGVLKSDDSMHVMAAFLAPQSAIGDKRLLDLIREGQSDKAVARAKAMAAPMV